jgi:acetylornithine deacetylase/succinyl-diaminopimelate desuccinylase-like protein
VDYGQPSAIHELSALITRITSLPVPSQPRSSMNVGVISGGTTVNTIAAQAECLLDLRSEDGEILTRLAAEVEALVGEGNRPGVHFSWEVVGFRPSGALQREHPLVQAAVRCLEAQGVTPTLSIGSTDANLPLSRGLPAVTIGLTNGGGAHTMGEYINIAPLERGLAQLYNLVLSLGSPGKT